MKILNSSALQNYSEKIASKANKKTSGLSKDQVILGGIPLKNESRVLLDMKSKLASTKAKINPAPIVRDMFALGTISLGTALGVGAAAGAALGGTALSGMAAAGGAVGAGVLVGRHLVKLAKKAGVSLDSHVAMYLMMAESIAGLGAMAAAGGAAGTLVGAGFWGSAGAATAGLVTATAVGLGIAKKATEDSENKVLKKIIK